MKKILIVDDDADVRGYLKELFKESGYELLLAANGNETLCIQNRHECDLIIIDIFMPLAEGLSTIVKIHQLYPKTKIIAISGGGVLGLGHYLDHALLYGADAALEKPIGGSQMLQTVSELLEEENSMVSAFCI